MALLVLLSATGFSVDVHYCQGQIKSFSLIGKAQSCHEKAAKKHCKSNKKSCHAAPSQTIEKKACQKNCCSDKKVEIENNDEAKPIPTTEISPVNAQFITAFVQVFLLEYTDLNKRIIPYLHYIPPLLSKNIPVLIQSFLL